MKISEILRVSIGKNCDIHPSVILATPPQHLDYYRKKKRHDGRIIIGDNVIIREFTNVHLPMRKNTMIGDNCFIMSHCHIAHDCHIKQDVIIATGVHFAGHTTILKGAYIGLNVSTHQYTTIGAYTMVGMGGIVVKDIPPFLVYKNSVCYKINETGMRRAGFVKNDVEEVYNYYVDNQRPNNEQIQAYLADFELCRNRKRKIADIFLDDQSNFYLGTEPEEVEAIK